MIMQSGKRRDRLDGWPTQFNNYAAEDHEYRDIDQDNSPIRLSMIS